MFKSTKEIEGRSIGSKIRLRGDVSVLKGTFYKGSVLEVIGEQDERGEFLCKDLDSGETVYLHPILCSYEKVN